MLTETEAASKNAQMYKEYNKRKGENRNSLLYNKQTTFQYLAQWQSKINALQYINPNAKTAKVLDVGCGDGESMLLYLQLGFEPTNLYGIDIWDDLINKAEKRLPSIKFTCADARHTDFDDKEFDIVTESTMFLQITDNDLAKEIGSEMIRVLKPGGFLVITDWVYGKKEGEFLPVNRERLSGLFRVGSKTKYLRSYNGAMVPPLGRFFSSKMPALYMPVKYIFPFTCAMKTYILQKNI